MYLHGGVDRFDTKEELIDKLRTKPRGVYFYCTNLVGSTWSGLVPDMPPGTILVVWGPDPWRDRRWRATIQRGRDGFQVK